MRTFVSTHDSKSSIDVQPDQSQAEENGDGAERAAEKILRARGQRRALRQAEKRAEQNAEGVEKCADAMTPIVAREVPSKEEFSFRRATSKSGDQRNRRIKKRFRSNPWFWIPTLYVAEGMPNALVVSVSVVLYKNLGVSNAAIAFYTGWLYLPWVIKPLWSPVVDILKTRRQWIWAMQLFLGAGLAGVALTIPAPHFFQLTLAFFWLLAFSRRRTTSRRTDFTCWRRRNMNRLFSSASAARFIASAKYRRAGRPGDSRGTNCKSAPAIIRPPGHCRLRSSPEFILRSAFIIVSFCRVRRLIWPGRRRLAQDFSEEFFNTFGDIFSEAENRHRCFVPVALPAWRGAIAENVPIFLLDRA